MKFTRTFGVFATAAALSVALTPAASADTVVTKDNVEMVLFGSGYHVNQATIHGIPEPQGPAQYEFIYSAKTSPTKTYTMICGGTSTGSSCLHRFTVNATYAHGVGIKSCGQIKRVDNQQILGTACKKW